MIKVLAKSNKRIDELCPHYQECGGCNISNLEYQEQLRFKENKVKNIFKKYLNMEISPSVIASPLEYKYRNDGLVTYRYNKNTDLQSVKATVKTITYTYSN